MKKLYLLFVFLFLILGWTTQAHAEDVVYLKDGSVIHGSITEEVPGVSVKIETTDGNIFVYRVKQISKITHSAAAAPAAEDQAPESDTTVVVVKHHRPARISDWKADPNASFSVGSIYFGVGLASAGVVDQYNTLLNNIGANAYNFTPLVYSGDIGVGWFTNHIGLKWTGTYAFNWDYEQTDYYYGGYYIGSTYINNFIDMYGSELELDLSLDDVQTSASRPNARRVFSVYVPIIVGFWAVDFVNENTGYDWYGTTTDFGSGLGLRFLSEDHWMFDMNFIYRGDNPGTLKNSTYGNLPLLNGKNMTADVSGFAANFNFGLTF